MVEDEVGVTNSKAVGEEKRKEGEGGMRKSVI